MQRFFFEQPAIVWVARPSLSELQALRSRKRALVSVSRRNGLFSLSLYV